MLMIDPEGLFRGGRLSQCSDDARLLWPYLFFASNSYGRLELDEALINSVAFATFKQPVNVGPALVEFSVHGLIFFYVDSDVQKLWGQWDTPERCLPKYKTARDRRSPAPDSKEFIAWRRARQAQDLTPFQKYFRKISEKFPAAVAVAVADSTKSKAVGPVETVENGTSKPAHEDEVKSDPSPNPNPKNREEQIRQAQAVLESRRAFLKKGAGPVAVANLLHMMPKEAQS